MLFIECEIGWSGRLMFEDGSVQNPIEIKIVEKLTNIVTLDVGSSIGYIKGLKTYDSRFITLSVGQYVTIKSHNLELELEYEIIVNLARIEGDKITLGIDPEESLSEDE